MLCVVDLLPPILSTEPLLPLRFLFLHLARNLDHAARQMPHGRTPTLSQAEQLIHCQLIAPHGMCTKAAATAAVKAFLVWCCKLPAMHQTMDNGMPATDASCVTVSPHTGGLHLVLLSAHDDSCLTSVGLQSCT